MIFMKNANKQDYIAYISCGAIFFILYIIQYSDIWDKEKMGFPQLMLCATILSGIFWGDKIGAIFGFFFGSMVDAVAYDVICFNTIFMLLCGYFSGILVLKLLNNNFRAAVLMSLGWISIYYFGKWCVLGLQLHWLENGLVHSAFLTVLYFMPMYGIMFLLNRKRTDKKQ